MRDDVQRDYDWQRRYIPAWKRILVDVLGAEMGLGGLVITEASFEEDAKHNTDLIVLHLQDLRIAVRTRRYEDLHGFHDREDQVTFRVRRANGVDTELVKILEGFGDVNAYGFANQADDGALCSWVIGKLDVFRHWFVRQLYQGPHPSQLPGMRQENLDRSSDFVGYYLSKMPASFVIKRHREADGPMFDPRVPF